jgi:hypothetical protein
MAEGTGPGKSLNVSEIGQSAVFATGQRNPQPNTPAAAPPAKPMKHKDH